MDRRAFLRLGLLTAIAAVGGVIYKSTEAVGADRYLRWMARGGVTRFLASPSRVGIYRYTAYDDGIAAVLDQAWQQAQMPNVRGLNVVLKPNLVEGNPDRPAYTHSSVVQALIQLLRDRGAGQVTVAEGTSYHRDSEAILQQTGYADMLDRLGVPFVDLNYDDLVDIPTKSAYTGLTSLLLPRTVCDAGLVVSVPKLKMHHYSTLSASVKNLFGIVPGIKYGWPKNTLHVRGLLFSLAELLDSLPSPVSAVVDGIVGMEGDGPIFGTPVASHCLVVGSQLLAVDATCARLAGLDPAKVDYLSFAAWAGLGTIDAAKIALLGTPILDLARTFALPPNMQ